MEAVTMLTTVNGFVFIIAVILSSDTLIENSLNIAKGTLRLSSIAISKRA